MNRLRAAVPTPVFVLLAIVAVAAPASALAVHTVVANRGPVSFQIVENGVKRWLGVAGKTSFSQWGLSDVDAYILGSNVCASVSVNGGGYFPKGPGYYGIPDAVSSVQVVSRYC